MTPRVVVVGGGITGLTYAHTLRREAARSGVPIDVSVYEAGEFAGGHARTLSEDGWLVETGPNGFLEREPETMALVGELGLTGRLVEARAESKKRFIVRDRKLHRVPDSPPGLIRTTALSWRGKLRLMGEPFAPGPPAGVDESVFAFAERRIGREAAETLVDTAVSGISAGDSRLLSVRAQFPIMVEMEREHGSLLRAMFARRKRSAGPGGRLFSFDRGLGALTSALAGELGEAVRVSTAVVGLERRSERWCVQLQDGRGVQADHVVMALPARGASRLMRSLDSAAAASLANVPYSSLSVVALGYSASALHGPLDGYGYLVPGSEKLATLGVLWESSIFPGRAPGRSVLLRVFLGGARRPDVVDLDAPATMALARAELAPILGIATPPDRSWVFQWPSAIAQYTIGHLERVADARTRLANHPGLELCGTSYDGVSFNHAVAGARRAARALASRFAA
jgi:oxygen-dependent protoporphyrinogen oxidase